MKKAVSNEKVVASFNSLSLACPKDKTALKKGSSIVRSQVFRLHKRIGMGDLRGNITLRGCDRWLV